MSFCKRTTNLKTVIGLVAVLMLAAACGGGNGGVIKEPAGGGMPDIGSHSWTGAAASGGLEVVAVNGRETEQVPETAYLELRTVAAGTNTHATISTNGLPATDHLFLHLRYDPALTHPRAVSINPELRADAFMLAITSEPGLVAIGIQTFYAEPVLMGSIDLCQLEFSPGAFPAGRGLSAVAETAVTDLHFDSSDHELLEWSYRNPGDYNQDSIVSLGDITPIAANWQASSEDASWTGAQVVDGSGDGIITLADMTPIGQFFQRQVTAYRIESAASETGPFSGSATVDFETGTEPAEGGFVQFSYTVPSPVNGSWYVVRALDGTEAATEHSNATIYSETTVLAQPVALSYEVEDDRIRLNWNAPSGRVPDYYNAYLSDVPSMSSAVQLNSPPTKINDTTFLVPATFSADNEYYFGVKAVYQTELSPYSNIVHYQPGVSLGAPTNVAGEQVDNFIRLSWDPPGAGTPDSYNVYIDDNDDFSDAVQLNAGAVTTTTYDVPTFIDPEESHWFGVKAVTGTDVSDFSTPYLYEPGGGGGDDTTPPVWQGGGEGVRTLAPESGAVEVFWYQATDLDSPPVTYYLYYAVESGEIDWDSPWQTVDSSQTSYVIPGLTNGQRYQFGVRAADSVDPPNVTTNTNVLFATPTAYPDDGQVGDVTSSDCAAAIMPGGEIPHIISVNHSTELNYSVYSNGDWVTVDLNDYVDLPERKYHPQAIGVGDNLHIVFGTPSGVYEYFGEPGTDFGTDWELKTIADTNVNNVFGIGFDYSAEDDYFGIAYATNNSGEKLYYSERGSASEWNTPIEVMEGNPEIWQCDFAINDYNGSQWIVAASGYANDQTDALEFWYANRDSRMDAWSAQNSYAGGDVMVVAIDPVQHIPIVACAEVREVSTDYGPAPVSDATIFTWNGGGWSKNVLEQGDFEINMGDFTQTTTLTGQDPQIVFSPAGKAVSTWSNIEVTAFILDSTAEITGKWRYSQYTGDDWTNPQSMNIYISSGNAVAASEGYKHCVTSNMGFSDSGPLQDIFDKYSARNDYAEGELTYYRHTW